MSQTCEETAVVTELLEDGRAAVKIRRAEACQGCAAKGACETLGGNKTKDMLIVVDNDVQAVLGDEVIISLAESSVITASAVLYMIPAVGLIGGALLGWGLGPAFGWRDDPSSIVGAVSGLLLGLGTARVLSSFLSKSRRFIPKLVGIKTRVRD